MSNSKEDEARTSGLTPREVYQLLLENRVDLIEISLCSSNSSVVVKSGAETLLILTGLNYNDLLPNSFRCILQNIIEDPTISVLSKNRTNDHGLFTGKTIIEISSLSGDRISYLVTSQGISNKFNRLVIERVGI
ncbi:MAG: hypothetical protein UW68_C0017G0012 [Candidatus Collierbacteria bacterium GW2011_GWB1_44_6]|uniref:Uncharacterized protein n=2 Tax=Candidatus Collieribacteriota TaxID=1752725 RepID=A0A0G1LW80_9BACT|nr:MAG: hypothetical protein UV68_C0002G0028 [Candidatus Collierbacteria bacterium GW2011_GWC2_43_12]KKT73077.1 MAG: hypothetical protein UW68_C0017G0012 [Candidatus Collierbacteria bacterium GW2011_GWB1_44_6]KKT83212.1 MAG: hypothetical protein UW80_C0019G0022 [Microgenomates group bacterium GW2011_GWC1_44_9]